ncbi:hypothetical protein [Halalkalirubrum salinum]|uniref:hypothetical protein n=1 Tax=Halalkalirubrum salinum TaxID=2563889 RepID=UPI0010FB37C5|nr:hypothetical protein [Halalkalirubrum salinum]
MWSSSLPTGTVSTDRSGDRTYPLDPPPTDEAATPTYPTRTELEAAARDRDRAVSEAKQLRTQVSMLRTELDRERSEREQVVERYEYLLADLQRLETERTDAGTFERVGARLDAMVETMVGYLR